MNQNDRYRNLFYVHVMWISNEEIYYRQKAFEGNKTQREDC